MNERRKKCAISFGRTIAVSCILLALTATTTWATALRVDIDRSNAGSVSTPLQAGWESFSANTSGTEVRSFANDELAGLGNSVDISISGQCCFRDYRPATGIFAPSSDLLSTGVLINKAGTINVDIDNLLDGTYTINTYHFTSQNGPSERTLEPFDLNLTDGVVTNSSIVSGSAMSDNGSSTLNVQSFNVTVVGGSPVNLDLIRGGSTTVSGMHVALAGIEIFTAANPPAPVSLALPPTDLLNVDFSSLTNAGGGPGGTQTDFYEFAGDFPNPVGGDPTSITRNFAFDHSVSGTVDVTIENAVVFRDYTAATGIFASQSALLSDGPLLNDAGTLSLTLEDLEDGTYEITTYHHTTDNGPDERPPATPFDIELTDGVVTSQVVGDDLIMSDNASLSLSTATFSFTVVGGSPVEIDFIRAEGTGEDSDDHFALPGFTLTQTVPEPSTFVLLGTMLLALPLFWRVRKSKKNS